jgi:hypothetical protein
MKKSENINNNYMNKRSEQLQLVKYCEWKNCNNKGIHRAPKNREYLREFRWFCLEHVREYNKNWNYFSGLSQKEIEKELKADFTWHLPTWPMNAIPSFDIIDDFDILKSSNINKKNDKTNKVENNKITKAFKKLGLSIDSSLQDIKRQYKVLVKKYHPDANKNNSKSNNKLIEINEAYKIIIDNY